MTPGDAPVGTTYTWTAPTYTGGVAGGSAQAVPQLNISGTLTVPSGSGTAIYSVTPVSGACTGAPFTLTVTVTSTCTAVGITTQPSGSSMCVTSGNASFTVVPSGTAPFTYQWQYNNGTWVDVADGTPAGATYTNATTATLDVAGITAAANYQYRVIITNCSGGNTITSNAATLAVNALPTVTFNGALATQCITSTTYALTGGAPAGGAYSGPGVTGTNFNASVAGAGNHTLTYTYTDGNGCINSATNTIAVNDLPVIADKTTSIVSGGTFNVTPGDAPVGTTYTWTAPTYTGGVAGGSAQAVPQLNISGTLTVPSGSGTAIYSVTPVSGACTGAPFTLTVTVTSTCTAVGITTQPSGSSMCVTSGSASFTVVPSGTAPFTYQWQYNNGTWVDVADGTPAGATYTNATTATLDVAGITAAANYQYRVIITNCSGGNTITSNAATLAVNALPTVTFNGALATQCITSTTYALTGGAPAGGAYSGPGVTGTNFNASVAGAGNHTLTYTYTDGNGCINSATNTIAVIDLPVIADKTTSIVTGGTFNVTPGDAPVGTTYTWTAPTYTGGVAGGSAQAVPQLNITGTFTVPSGSGTAIYSVTPVSGACTGAPFTLTVTVTSTCTAVGITTQPSNSNMCVTSGSASFTVVPSGTAPFTYQWQYNNGTWVDVADGTPAGATYTNATTATLDVAGITAAANYQYRVIITNCSGGNTITSNAATLAVNALPTVTFNGALATQCITSTTYALTGGAPAGGAYSGPGVTGTNFNASVAGAGNHTLTYTYTDGNGCINSATNTIAVSDLPVIADKTTSIVTGGTFNVTPGDAPVGTTYTWTAPTYTGGVAGGSAQAVPQLNISGTFTVPSGSGTAIYSVTPVSGACTGAPFTLTVTVTSTCTAVGITTQPSNTNMCVTSGNASFTVVPSGTAPFTYQWQYNNGTWVDVADGTPAGATYTNATTATLDVAGITAAANYQYRVIITNCSGGNTITSNAATLAVNALRQ